MEKINIHTKRLRTSGLRPTKQRIALCQILFDRNETFHFTIDELKKIAEKKNNKKISLATLYNTVHAFKEKGYLKEVWVKGNKTFFDTNIKSHYHFYDEDKSKLIDIENKNISVSNISNLPKGKKIREIEVIIKVASNNQKQKK